MSTVRWLKIVLITTILLLSTMIATIICLDPFGVYGIKNRYYNDLRGATIGLMKHADYDSVIIGSSMAQNFDLKQVQNHIGRKAVKLTLNGLGLEDILFLLGKLDSKKVANLMIVVDFKIFNEVKDLLFMSHLADSSMLNDISYWLSYDLWIKGAPRGLLRLMFSYLQKSGYGNDFVDRERLGEWASEFVFGKSTVIDNYIHDRYAASPMDTRQMLPRMQKQFDRFFAALKNKWSDTRVYLVLPPYSALYWHVRAKEGSLKELAAFKDTFLKTFKSCSNIRCFDFQTIPAISDLNFYKDSTHYSPYINRLMIDYIAENSELTGVISAGGTASLEEILADFSAENANWLK